MLAFVAQANSLLLTRPPHHRELEKQDNQMADASSLFRVLETALERTARYSGKGFCPASLPPLFRLVEVLVRVHKQLSSAWPEGWFDWTFSERYSWNQRLADHGNFVWGDESTVAGKLRHWTVSPDTWGCRGVDIDHATRILEEFAVPRVPSRAERRDSGWLQELLCSWMDSFCFSYYCVTHLHYEFLLHGQHEGPGKVKGGPGARKGDLPRRGGCGGAAARVGKDGTVLACVSRAGDWSPPELPIPIDLTRPSPTFNKWLLQSLLLGASVESGGGEDEGKEGKADRNGDAHGDGRKVETTIAWGAAMRAESLCCKRSTEISDGDSAEEKTRENMKGGSEEAIATEMGAWGEVDDEAYIDPPATDSG